MCRPICKPPLIAFVVSTLITIALLAAGMQLIVIPNPLFFLGVLAIFAIAVIASENACDCAKRDCGRAQPGAEDFGKRRYNWCCRVPMWAAIALLVTTIVLSALVEGVLAITLIPLWIILFLVITLFIELA